jgi:hypothetical protein
MGSANIRRCEEGPKGHFGVGSDDAQQAVQIAILENDALANEREVILENTFRSRYGFGLTLNFEGVFPQLCADIQAGFEQPDILIPRAEKAFNAVANLNDGFHLFGVKPPGNAYGQCKHQML